MNKFDVAAVQMQIHKIKTCKLQHAIYCLLEVIIPVTANESFTIADKHIANVI